MRIVRAPKEMLASFDACSREAMAAFGDPTVFVERLVVDPRHVEVQILGDSHGNLVHLYDRDCSVQLRNQKAIEIAPAPQLPEALRAAMLKDAVRLANGAGYTNAGLSSKAVSVF